MVTCKINHQWEKIEDIRALESIKNVYVLKSSHFMPCNEDGKTLQESGVLQKLIAFNHLVELHTVNRWLAASAMGFLYFVEIWRVIFSFLQFFAGLLGIFLVLCYVMTINDCFDVEEDKIKSEFTGKKIIVSEEISVRDALLLSLIMLVAGVAISWFVSETFFIIVLLIVGLSTLYSVPPVRYKRIFPFSTLGESVGAFLPFLAGYSILGFPDAKALVVSAFFAMITIYLRFFHEAIFYKVDSRTGKTTFAVVYGPNKAHNIGRFCLLLSVLESLILFFLAWFSFEFLVLQGLYLLFSLGLMFTFLKLHIPKGIINQFSTRITGRIPRSVKNILEDRIIPLWGFVLLVIAIAFLIV